jgi:hypothetical protein
MTNGCDPSDANIKKIVEQRKKGREDRKKKKGKISTFIHV